MKDQKTMRDYGTRQDGTLFRVDPRIIEIEEGHNPRNYDLPENRAHLDELKISIGKIGVQEALKIRFEKPTGKIILIDGECRLRATMELISEGRDDIKNVPALVVSGGNEKGRLYSALIANTGKPLSTWENGTAFQRLMNFGDTKEEIHERTGYSMRFINEALELADAPEAVKRMISARDVTPSLALHELRTKATGEAIESLREKAVEAKKNGKGPARKTQENKGPNPTTMINLIVKLVESIEDELFDGSASERFVEVDKATMRKLANMVGIQEKAKKATA